MDVAGDKIIIANNSPFNINVNEIKSGGQAYSPGLLPPLDKILVKIRNKPGRDFTLSVINDYGGLTNYVGYWDNGHVKFREKV
ncbi:hypothetical protein EXB32_13055 [Salmonella enterica subsp. enterica serovar Stanley]|nr:hypothetical protein [Salmonella enterica subsp. enterica serovar Stanley]